MTSFGFSAAARSSGDLNGTDQPRVWFRLPEAFTRLPSPDDGVQDTGEWERYLDEVLPEGEEIPREAIKEQYTALRRMENLQGVVGSAVCCGEMDDHVTMAYLTVAFAPSQHDDPVVAAEGLYRIQVENSQDDGGADFAEKTPGVAGEFTSSGRLVLATDLPVGPAVTVLNRRIVTAPPNEQHPDGIRVPIGVIQVFIPAPAHRHLAVLTLMTPTPQDFDDYARAMAAMAATVCFGPYDPAVQEARG